MKLKLVNGEIVEVFRQNCGYQFGKDCSTSVNWNINPIELVHDSASGFFVIGPWGSGYRDIGCSRCRELVYDPSQFEKMIPVRSVLSIEDAGNWEMER